MRGDDIVSQIRKIASRGRMDDADVQVVFDAADEIERLCAEERLVLDHIMFLLDHSELWQADGWSIQMPDGWRYHRG